MSGPCIHSFITLLGSISVTEDGEGRVTALYLPCQNLPAMEERETDVLAEAAGQVNEYLAGRRRVFDVPLGYGGSEFRVSVLEAVMRIPYGATATYGRVAEAAGSPGAYRAVGTVCAGNCIPIIIPCHRVVPGSGGAGNYSGGTSLKSRLLELERGSDDRLARRGNGNGRPQEGGVQQAVESWQVRHNRREGARPEGAG